MNYLSLNRKDNVKGVCAALMEGYMRAANRSSKKLDKFLIKMYHLSFRKNFFSVFTVFLRPRFTKLFGPFSGILPAIDNHTALAGATFGLLFFSRIFTTI